MKSADRSVREDARERLAAIGRPAIASTRTTCP
jgi:hypothetical protein